MKDGIVRHARFAQGLAIVERFLIENESLLVHRNSFLLRNDGLDSLDRVARIHLDGDLFARQRPDNNLLRIMKFNLCNKQNVGEVYLRFS